LVKAERGDSGGRKATRLADSLPEPEFNQEKLLVKTGIRGVTASGEGKSKHGGPSRTRTWSYHEKPKRNRN